MASEAKISNRPSRRTAWGGEIYRNIESGDFDEKFLQTKSEFLHTTKALTRYLFEVITAGDYNIIIESYCYYKLLAITLMNFRDLFRIFNNV